jgi:type IX secretion system substrate protein
MLKYILLILIVASTSFSAEQQWIQKNYAEEESYKSMVYLDSLNFYAFTDSVNVYKVFRSTDKGESWKMLYRKRQSLLTDSIKNINHCWVSDSSTIYLVYRPVIIEKSTDGGKTFNRITFGEISGHEHWPIYDFIMYDKNLGIICSYYYLIVTRDAWETYEVIPKNEYEPAGDPFFFVDSNNVAFLRKRSFTSSYVLFNLETKTSSEYSEEPELEPGEPHMSMFDVTFVNDTLGFACGGQENGNGDARYDIIWKTIDKGRNWRIVHNDNGPIEGFGLTSISFADESHGMATASWGIGLETTDGGETWEYIKMPKEAEDSLGDKIIFAGEYPILTTFSGFLFRQEVVNEVEEYEDANLKIYQSFDELVIEQLNKPASILQFQIVDLLGRELFKESYENQQNISIDLSQIKSGFYIYRIISDGRILRTGKIIR